MSINHKELNLSPSGKIPYLIQAIYPGSITSTANTTYNTPNVAAPGTVKGTATANADWILTTPAFNIGEVSSTLNGGKITVDGQIALNFTNSAAQETINVAVANPGIPFLTLAVHPPEGAPIQKSDFRKSPSGKVIMCYERISVPAVAVTHQTFSEVIVNSECADFVNLAGGLVARDYIFAAPVNRAIPASAKITFNYAYVVAHNQIALRFLSDEALSDISTLLTDWVFLIVKNTGQYGTYNPGV